MLDRRIRTDGFIDPCIPSRAATAPVGAGWVHEIKHDGQAVRLFTRRGYDWTERYPAIAAAALRLRARSFTLDGEAVVSDKRWRSDFAAFLADVGRKRHLI